MRPTSPTIGSDTPTARTAPSRPRVVIVGAGFGGLTAAQHLAGWPVDVTVIDRRNYHLFQPLLYQVATAGLSPAQIAQPIRGILHGAANVRVLMGRVGDVDTRRRMVQVDDREVAYDHLILATGARHSYFGRDEWEKYAPGLKKIDDATEIRRRILTAFELAETEDDPVARRRLLTFIVIGAGPTGVEMAGAIAELARRALARDFRRIDPRSARILLVEAGPRVLAAFPEALSQRALGSLRRLGVEVKLGVPVSAIDADGITLGAERIASATVMSAAGVRASAAAKWLKAEADKAGRVKVQPDLSVPDHPEIFVIGDTALALDPSGKPYPGLAPVAKQQGRYVAELLRARLADAPAPGPFVYRDWGAMATIGRNHAVAHLFSRYMFGGLFAWLLWGVVHVMFLAGFRNRLTVLMDWMWSYVTFQSGARLITGGPRAP
ncbi:MAG: NAD(P)/FAD-dependent oxidoreductase [Alphaproteobacteria bacterium]|nr:NAD(P)/FAD-dependent oxidoreductase [Alphaproteobacteria bacterium]